MMELRNPFLIGALLVCAHHGAMDAYADESAPPYTGEISVENPGETDEYWTEERMRNAKPMDMVINGEPSPDLDKAATPPPTEGGGAGASGEGAREITEDEGGPDL